MPRHASYILKTNQLESLKENKIIHGLDYKQCLVPGMDTPACHVWLTDGRLRSDTEGLIVAAQDGVILT